MFIDFLRHTLAWAISKYHECIYHIPGLQQSESLLGYYNL